MGGIVGIVEIVDCIKVETVNIDIHLHSNIRLLQVYICFDLLSAA